MEEEAREILPSVLTASSTGKGNLAEAIRRRFSVFGGLEFAHGRVEPFRRVSPQFRFSGPILRDGPGVPRAGP
jgi:hypothetical protein